MPFFKLGAVLACALAAGPLHAQTSLVVTLSSVHDRVRSQNPDLVAARLRIDEAQGRLNQAGRLANPELESSFQHNPAFNEGVFEIGISQRFPLTKRLQLEKNVSLMELEAAETEVKDVERRLASEAGAALIEILVIRQRRELLADQSQLAGQLAETLQQAAEKGEASLLDASQARVEILRHTTAIRQLDAAEAAAIGRLKPLLGMRPGAKLVVSGKLPDVVLPRAKGNPNNRPDYRASQLLTEAAAQGIALEQARRVDDLEGGFFTGIERSEDLPEGRRNEGIIGVRFKIALPFWDKNEGGIQQAQARHARKQLETIALGRAIALEAEAALAEMREWAAIAGEISTRLLPLAADHAEKTAAAYQAAQADLPSVLRAREQGLQLAGSHLDALREFHLARLRYSAAIGQP